MRESTETEKYIGMCACYDMCVEIRGQLVETYFLIAP